MTKVQAYANAPSTEQLVEVEIRGDILSSYRDRRDDSGFYVALQKEDVSLGNYISIIDSAFYSDMFGEEPISMGIISLNYKLNYFFGAIAVGVEGGQGSIKDDLSGQERSLELKKTGLNFLFIADAVMPEPYLAPYAGVTFWQFEMNETKAIEKLSKTTQMGTNLTAGVLIQLNWLDLDTSRNAVFNWGLENTYIDLFVTQYDKTSGLDDPNTQTGSNYGAGVRFEF